MTSSTVPDARRATGERDLDIVLFGASGYVGRLVAGYLAEHAPSGVRIGLAGRSLQRISAVRELLGPAAVSWPLLVADSADRASLVALAGASRVVATTVGPYGRYGLPLVAACANAGTHYADLAGEVLFMRDSIEAYHGIADARGARIVHGCGFDSIPSDLGVLSLHDAARTDSAGDLGDTTMLVTGMKGGFSGGTLAAFQLTVDEVRASAPRRRLLADPYALSPQRSAEPSLGDESDLSRVARDDTMGIWVGPFIMAGVNTRVVRRSNALQNWAYGRGLRYREVVAYGTGSGARRKAVMTGVSLGALFGGLAFRPTRALLNRVLPAPGEGPDEKTRRAGYFRMEMHSKTTSGAQYVSRLELAGDPGYAATSVMLGESALCLALDAGRLPDRAGVLTPATAMGLVLTERLMAAGQTFSVQRLDPTPPRHLT